MDKMKDIKDYIVSLMKSRTVTRGELRTILGCSDREARRWVATHIKGEHPVISTGSGKGYRIATSIEQLDLARIASSEMHRKASAIHRSTEALDRWIAEAELAVLGQGRIEYNNNKSQTI